MLVQACVAMCGLQLLFVNVFLFAHACCTCLCLLFRNTGRRFALKIIDKAKCKGKVSRRLLDFVGTCMSVVMYMFVKVSSSSLKV